MLSFIKTTLFSGFRHTNRQHCLNLRNSFGDITPNLLSLSISGIKPSSSVKHTSGLSSKFSTCSSLANTKITREFDYLTAKHLQGPVIIDRPIKNPLGHGIGMQKAVVIRTVIKKPKKPNSANRKCVLVRIPKTGKEIVAFVPGRTEHTREIF